MVARKNLAERINGYFPGGDIEEIIQSQIDIMRNIQRGNDTLQDIYIRLLRSIRENDDEAALETATEFVEHIMEVLNITKMTSVGPNGIKEKYVLQHASDADPFEFAMLIQRGIRLATHATSEE